MNIHSMLILKVISGKKPFPINFNYFNSQIQLKRVKQVDELLFDYELCIN